MFGFNILTNAELKAIRNEAFERGERHGKDIAIYDLRDAQKYSVRHLSNDEYAKVIAFLKENNLEFGYDAFEGGFYVLKRTP
jgi:hypothetical protein